MKTNHIYELPVAELIPVTELLLTVKDSGEASDGKIPTIDWGTPDA